METIFLTLCDNESKDMEKLQMQHIVFPYNRRQKVPSTILERFGFFFSVQTKKVVQFVLKYIKAKYTAINKKILIFISLIDAISKISKTSNIKYETKRFYVDLNVSSTKN